MVRLIRRTTSTTDTARQSQRNGRSLRNGPLCIRKASMRRGAVQQYQPGRKASRRSVCQITDRHGKTKSNMSASLHQQRQEQDHCDHNGERRGGGGPESSSSGDTKEREVRSRKSSLKDCISTILVSSPQTFTGQQGSKSVGSRHVHHKSRLSHHGSDS